MNIVQRVHHLLCFSNVSCVCHTIRFSVARKDGGSSPSDEKVTTMVDDL
jgi:hypothetical protein